MELAGGRTMVKLYLDPIYRVSINHAVSLIVATMHTSNFGIILQLAVCLLG